MFMHHVTDPCFVLGQVDPSGRGEPYVEKSTTFWFTGLRAFNAWLRATTPSFHPVPVPVHGWDKILETAVEFKRRGVNYVAFDPVGSTARVNPLEELIERLRNKNESGRLDGESRN